ncbi:Crp/Fnr family transcriptional regulator [Caulobacter sp. UNC279MFTsu5.1]|uniref:Crp/Fnr family transcriptional regulator n=1 Tax=Caulobacter sp. UNC279MFTsu5.1 TaxID=1502775 RepID=UPI0008EB0A2E|nr:Crp/Fnr family transcriptional regulator [Caulobacter sp. UNC279MFTsu5.1]SFJ90160.1 cAMP-binding domain of CRP or a regulatory subunit of cAMP-dependent protein kinases [Caulobacter sp. UNC279MFTsu5.1]
MEGEAYSVGQSSFQVSTLGDSGSGQISDVERVRAFWRRVEHYDAGSQVRQGERTGPGKQLIIVSGWACELRILPDGRRQIFSFLLPGDAIEARGAGSVGACGVVALTRLEVVNRGPQLTDSACRDAALQRERRLYDHLMRMGRLSAKERVIHLLLELHERLERVGLVHGETFKIPLTQEVFADALGLSVVHINRTLKGLRKEGWVYIKAGSVTLRNRPRLAAASCYRSEADDLEFDVLTLRASEDCMSRAIPSPKRNLSA